MFLRCLPCCGGCGIDDGKPRTDPATEGHWVPSGTWATGVTWTFSSSPSTTDGGTWFFYGSASTSKVGGGATLEEQRDWGNICNWYSNKTTTPSSLFSLTTVLDKRATRLPPTDAVVHVYSSINTTTTGPVTVKNAYFWSSNFITSEMTTTSAAYDSDGGTVFNSSFNLSSSTVNGGATFNDFSANSSSSTVNGGATFNGTARNISSSTVNGGATFNDSSRNSFSSTVNGGATFNDAACSERTVGSFANCPGAGKRIFVAHPTDIPTCNGTAPDGCANAADTCGCG